MNHSCSCLPVPQPQQCQIQAESWTYTTATAMPDLSLVCSLHHSSLQHRILNPLIEARDGTRNLMVPSHICFLLSHERNPLFQLLDPLSHNKLPALIIYKRVSFSSGKFSLIISLRIISPPIYIYFWPFGKYCDLDREHSGLISMFCFFFSSSISSYIYSGF